MLVNFWVSGDVGVIVIDCVVDFVEDLYLVKLVVLVFYMVGDVCYFFIDGWWCGWLIVGMR